MKTIRAHLITGNPNDDYYRFEAGMMVVVTRAVNAAELGLWDNSWHPRMNNNIGKIGMVIDVSSTLGILVRSDGDNVKTWWYPACVLEEVSK